VPFSLPTRQTLPLRDIVSTDDYFVRVNEVTLKLEPDAEASEVIDLLHEGTSRLGADVSCFLTFIREDLSLASFRFLLACDPQWCVDYEASGWYTDDPWLAYARAHSEPVLASRLSLHSDKERELVRLAGRYGFESALIVPAPSSGGLTRIGMLCLGSFTPGFFEDAGLGALKLAARPLSTELHEWSTAQLRRELIGAARISSEELILLERQRRGFTTKRIASSTGFTHASVNSRFQRLIAKLDVPNRREAARLAAEYGLI
jgi:DNA-binding CsgD family transcriptional regulator